MARHRIEQTMPKRPTPERNLFDGQEAVAKLKAPLTLEVSQNRQKATVIEGLLSCMEKF